MTLMEFLHPLRQGKQRDLVLATLYFFKRYKQRDRMTAPDVRSAMVQAKVPRAKLMNVNAVINESAPYAQGTGAKESGAFLFELTGTGEDHVRDLLGLPAAEAEVEHDVTSLENIAARLTDAEARGYVEEAIQCLRVGALRAAVVFLWTGAARTLQGEALKQGNTALNAALQKHDKRVRSVSKVDDFAFVKDRILLLTCGDLGLLDKGERSTLEEALGLRNRCGHPTKYRPRSAKVTSFIEDVIGIVWQV